MKYSLTNDKKEMQTKSLKTDILPPSNDVKFRSCGADFAVLLLHITYLLII